MYSVRDPNNRSARESDGAIDAADRSYDSRGRLERGRVWGLGGDSPKTISVSFFNFSASVRVFAYNHRRLRVSWYAERSTFGCLWVTLDADVEISNKENYPGPVLIDLLCATNLLASQILTIKIIAETLRSSIDVLNLQLKVTLELLFGRLSIFLSSWSTKISHQHPYI